MQIRLKRKTLFRRRFLTNGRLNPRK